MFINHMIEKLDDFKEMLAGEIEEIMQKGDQGFEMGYEGLGIRNKIKKSKTRDISAPSDAEDNESRIPNISKNVPKTRNKKTGVLKDRSKEIVPSDFFWEKKLTRKKKDKDEGDDDPQPPPPDGPSTQAGSSSSAEVETIHSIYVDGAGANHAQHQEAAGLSGWSFVQPSGHLAIQTNKKR